MTDSNEILTANTSQVELNVPPADFITMELRVQNKTIGDKLVAYGSVGDQTFYVQAFTPDELQDKLSKKIRELMKQNPK